MDVSDIAGCLRAQDHGHPPVICLQANAFDRDVVSYEISAGVIRSESKRLSQTLRARMGTGGGNVPIVLIGNEDE